MTTEKIKVAGRQVLVDDRGSGRVLLLVHGFPLDHSMWRGQLETLSQHYRVIAPDLPGFGASEPMGDKASMEEFADVLAELIEELGVRGPVTLGGLSMGGYIAWQFWNRHSQRLDRLVLCDTRAAADADDAARTRLETADRVIGEGAAVLVDGMLPKLFATNASPQLLAETADVIRAAQPVGVAAALRGMAERVDARPWLPKIQVPTLLIGGQQDAISPPDEMREIAEAMPNARFVMVPRAGHMAPLEQPEQVNLAIREFLDE